jgi:NAD(P)-dependent dehydrogenase (short-subunit alcohol dehydrogenase family)
MIGHECQRLITTYHLPITNYYSPMANRSFDQKTVVITGAGQGLGFGMARRFGQTGAHVVIAEIDADAGAPAAEMLRGEGFATVYEKLDVSEPAQCTALVSKLVKERGRIDVWVNNAGVSRIAPAESMPLAYWDDSIAVMLSGTFYCSQAAGKQMLAQGSGVIINVSGVTGMLHEKDHAAYSAAKAGVVALTEALGVEWAGRGVRVVGVAPSVILTDVVKQALEQQGESPLRKQIERRTPMKRPATVEEIAETVLYLASDEASYIVAETIRVDGGMVAYQLF